MESEILTTVAPLFAKSPKIQRAVQVALLARAGYAAYRSIRDRFERDDEQFYTVVVEQNDDLYTTALRLIQKVGPEQDWRSVVARLGYDRQPGLFEDPWELAPRIDVEPGSEQSYNISVSGHRVRVSLSNGESNDEELAATSSPYREPRLIFVAKDSAGQQAVLDGLLSEAEIVKSTRSVRTAHLFVYGEGRWKERGPLPARAVESVVTADNLVQDIVDDLQRFRSKEEAYVSRGVPYHRGYLLYGPPGTGKTSAVKAVANALKMDLYYASLGSAGTDTALSDIVADVPSNSILLLEDIDAFAVTHARTEDHAIATGATAGLSTTGLLNVLDGVNTPHGQITFLTTNHREFLDPALIRPGRVDRQYHFPMPDDSTVERHFAYFYGEEPTVPLEAAGRSGAEVNEILISNLEDPAAAQALLAKEEFDD